MHVERRKAEAQAECEISKAHQYMHIPQPEGMLLTIALRKTGNISQTHLAQS